MRALTFRVGNRRQKRDFGAARIEPRVLHDDRDVGFEYRGIVGVARDRLRVVKIIEAQVQRAAGGDGHAVRADRLPAGEENGNRDARVALSGIENAGGLVGDQRAVGKGAFGGYVTFGDGPSPASNGLHAAPPFFPLKLLTRTAGLSFRAARTFFCLGRREVKGVLPKSRNRVAGGRAESFTALRGESARRDPNARQSKGRDARNHRFARHRLLGEARGGPRTTGVGWPGFGAHLGAWGVRDRPRNPRRPLWLCASRSAAPHSRP